MRERDLLLLALGGLLHDIGKLYRRAEKETGTGRRSSESEHFGYAHAEKSYEVAKNILQKIGIGGDDAKKVLSACFHHNPTSDHPEVGKDFNEFKAIFRLADFYASVERSEDLDVEREEAFKRLRPVFEIVRIDDLGGARPHFYKLSPLELGEDIEPVLMEEARDYSEELFEEYYGKYEDLKRGFEEAFEKDKELTDLNHKLSYVYHILYRYTWCVPASIWDPERYHSHYPDVSLFDHSRVVSALATSLYPYKNCLKDYNDEKKKREKIASNIRLLIFEGDITGIQRFLYDLANVQFFAKRLRGRSCFLSLLPEMVGRYILRELGYPFTNILYAGGGKFQAVVGYEEGIERKIEDLSRKVEEILIREFGGKMGIVTYSTVFTLVEIKDYHEVIKRLHGEAQKAKKRKFSLVMEDFEYLANRRVEGPSKICPSCNWELIPEGEDFCRWCEDFADVGGVIPKSEFILFTRDRKDLEGFYLKDIGGVYFLKEEELKNLESDYEDLFVLNEVKKIEDIPKVTGFRFIANTAPTKEDEEALKSFEELSEEAEGDKKIAFVRADVDNLGYIFMKGLGKNYTISRVATLSRSLDLFFSGYINHLMKDLKDYIYVVYGGGDDLFLVGPWDKALETVRRIRKEFRYFTCKNPVFGLSCGLFVSHGKFPIRLGSERAGEEEKRAKDKKDSITALGEVLSWDLLEEALERGEKVAKWLKEGSLGRTSFYRIYKLIDTYRKKLENKEEEGYMFYPFFYYYLVRNVKEEKIRKDIESYFLNTENGYELREEAEFLAKYVLMKTRGVRVKES